MRVIGFEKKRDDLHMTIKMEFTLKNGGKRIVDLPYTEAMKNCRKIIINRTEQFLVLDGVQMDKQDRQMEAFVEQQLEIFQDDATPVENLGKPVLELNRPDVATIQDKYYWISGQAEVYLLNTENFLAYKMTPVEIEEMPVDLIYSGQEKTNFLVDERLAMEIILLILLKVNVMQSSEIYSFPLGL